MCSIVRLGNSGAGLDGPLPGILLCLLLESEAFIARGVIKPSIKTLAPSLLLLGVLACDFLRVSIGSSSRAA